MAEVTRTRGIYQDGIRVSIEYTFQYDEFDYPDWDPWDPDTDPPHVDDGGSWDEENMELVNGQSVVITVQDGGQGSRWLVEIYSGASGNVWESAEVTEAAGASFRPRGQVRTVRDISQIDVSRVA